MKDILSPTELAEMQAVVSFSTDRDAASEALRKIAMHCLAEATEAALDIAAAPRDAVLDLLQRVPGSSVNDQKVLEQMVFIAFAHAYPIGRSQSFVYFETDSLFTITLDTKRLLKDNKHWENIGFFRKKEGEGDGEGVVMVFAPIDSPGEFTYWESFKGPINFLPGDLCL
jgi:hypothetical protein